MRTLTGREILDIWEIGQGQHPLDRALTMLHAAFPEATWEKLARLSVGQRDTCLLAVREQTFGTHLSSRAVCPACREQAEFTLNTSELHASPDIEPADQVQHIIAEGYEVQFRLPNSSDLAALLSYQDVTQARRLLLQRCIVQVSKDGAAVKAEDLPENVIMPLAARMDELDPQAETRLDLVCSACGHHWQVLFDIISFLWTEMSVSAKRLLGEVHILAQVYGWRELDILSMSAVRRQFYLEMVTDG